MNTTSIHTIYNDFYISSFTESLTFDDIKFPANESLNSIISFIKTIYRKIIEYIKKFIQWLKDLFRKAIKYIKSVIKKFIITDFKHRILANEAFLNIDADVEEHKKELINYINSKSLKLVRNKEFIPLINIIKSFLKNFDKTLIKLKEIMDTKKPMNKSMLGLYIDFNIISFDNEISDKTKDFLIGKSNTFGDKVFGYQIFEYNDIDFDLSELTAKNVDTIYYSLLKQIDRQIDIIDTTILPELDNFYKYCEQNLGNNSTQLTIQLENKILENFKNEDLSKFQNFYNSTFFMITSTVKSISTIIASNIDQIIPFYNTFINKFRKEVQDIVELKKKQITINNPEFIQKELNKIIPYTKIKGINCYKFSSILPILNKNKIYEINSFNSYCLYIPYSISQFIIIGDRLIEIFNTNELKFTIAHEYGHCVLLHNLKEESDNLFATMKNAKIEQQNRSIKEEIEADSKAVSMIGLDNSIDALLGIKRKLNKYSDSDINTRIIYLQNWKKLGYQPNINL